MFILKFILLLLLFGLLLVGILLLSVWQQLKGVFRRFREQPGNQQEHIDGNVVIDRRTTEQVSKKIIPREEGEYVEYTEYPTPQ